MPDLLWPALVVFGGYVLLGLTGFGSALVIVPLLAWKWPLLHVVALVLMLDFPACLLHGMMNLKQVRWDEIRLMLPGMAFGSALGLWLVSVLEPRWPLLILGLYVLVMGFRQTRTVNPVSRNIPGQVSVAAGGVAGLVEMMFGCAGPVLITWLHWRVSDLMQMRATAPVLILCSASLVLGEMALAGKMSSHELWNHWLWLISVALLGTWAGDQVAPKDSKRWLKYLMGTLLVFSGGSLAQKALMNF